MKKKQNDCHVCPKVANDLRGVFCWLFHLSVSIWWMNELPILWGPIEILNGTSMEHPWNIHGKSDFINGKSLDFILVSRCLRSSRCLPGACAQVHLQLGGGQGGFRPCGNSAHLFVVSNGFKKGMNVPWIFEYFYVASGWILAVYNCIHMLCIEICIISIAGICVDALFWRVWHMKWRVHHPE